MLCKRCGQVNDENSDFCIYCGEEILKSKPEVETLNISKKEKNIQETLETSEIINNSNENIEENKKIDNQEESIQKEFNTDKKAIVNPISNFHEEIVDEKVNIIKLLLLTLQVMIKPGTTLVNKTKNYNNIKSGLFIYIVFSSITFITYMTTSIIKNCFIQTYNIATGNYTSIFDLDQLHYIDYATMAIEAILISYIISLTLITIYYISAFLTSKGISLSRCFAVIAFSLSPFLLLTCAAAPIITIINSTIGNLISIFGVIYSFIILICTLNDILIFKNTNQKISYHMICIIISFTIIYILFSLFAKNLIGF